MIIKSKSQLKKYEKFDINNIDINVITETPKLKKLNSDYLDL